MAHLLKFQEKTPAACASSGTPVSTSTIPRTKTTTREGIEVTPSIREEESTCRGALSVETEAKLKKWKARLVILEEDYDILAEQENPSWEEMKSLLGELKIIMLVKGLEDVVEYQHGIAKIKSKVLRIQRQKQERATQS
jgi:hypothetical protein